MTDSIALWVIHVGGSAIVVLAIAAFVLALGDLMWARKLRIAQHRGRTMEHVRRCVDEPAPPEAPT